MTRLTIRNLLVGVVLALPFSQTASAAEILYYLTVARDAPKEQRRSVQSPEGIPIYLAREPVARLSSAAVKEARISSEQIEVFDAENSVSELYRVTLIVDESERAKLAMTMDELCKTKAGVHIVVDDVAIDYRPFAVCGKFDTAVSFPDKAAAEQFAHKFAKEVTFAAPDKKPKN